jgi:hypothetical protein
MASSLDSPDCALGTILGSGRMWRLSRDKSGTHYCQDCFESRVDVAIDRWLVWSSLEHAVYRRLAAPRFSLMVVAVRFKLGQDKPFGREDRNDV